MVDGRRWHLLLISVYTVFIKPRGWEQVGLFLQRKQISFPFRVNVWTESIGTLNKKTLLHVCWLCSAAFTRTKGPIRPVELNGIIPPDGSLLYVNIMGTPPVWLSWHWNPFVIYLPETASADREIIIPGNTSSFLLLSCLLRSSTWEVFTLEG